MITIPMQAIFRPRTPKPMYTPVDLSALLTPHSKLAAIKDNLPHFKLVFPDFSSSLQEGTLEIQN